MDNSPPPYQFDLDKEVKRHKSAHIPAGSEALNKIFPNYHSNKNNINLNNKPNNDFFRIKSSSIFAYQEFDRFSSFCDNEEQANDEEKNIQSEGTNNKDEYNNCSTTFSVEINDDNQNNTNLIKRKSAINGTPNFSNYFNFQNQVLENNPNLENNIGGNGLNYDEFINENLNYDNRRRNTQKMNRNYFNAFFNDKFNQKNNQEQLNNFESRRKSNSLIYFKGYNNNFNKMNRFNNNNFVMSNNYNGNKVEDIKEKNEIVVEDDLNKNNKIDQNDLFINMNEYNEFVRKKSNSFAVKANTMLGQAKQINFPYQQNNKFYQTNSKHSSKSHKYLNNNDIYLNKKSNLYLICQDQANCRSIQDQLDLNKNDIKYITNFLEQIKPHLINIMTHQFGNYVIQKLLEILIYQENKELFTEIISLLDQNNSLYSISINNYGTRVIQKTLEKLIESGYNKIETPEINNCLKNLISEHLYDLCKDKNGNHVYQKLLKVFNGEKEETNNFLYDYLADIAVDVALLQQGATIFSTAINLGSYNQKEKMCAKINQNLDKLINNKYGNYSVQAIINALKDEKKLIEPIYLYISKNIVELSNQKYSSNVVDTFIMKKDDFSKQIINDIIKNNQIKDMIKDQYGNYVIQKAMSISDSETLNKIIEQIKPIIPELLENNLGKKIVNKLMQQYNNVL
jgi:hypothetical protein